MAYRRLKGLSLGTAEKAKTGAPLDIYAMDLASRETVNVTADWALRPGAPTWKPDGRYLYFDAGIGGSRHLFRASASGREPVEQISRGERWLTGFRFTRDREHHAYAARAGGAPSDGVASATGGSG